MKMFISDLPKMVTLIKDEILYKSSNDKDNKVLKKVKEKIVKKDRRK